MRPGRPVVQLQARPCGVTSDIRRLDLVRAQGFGIEPGPTGAWWRQVQIANRLRIEGPTITRMIDALSRDGLVERNAAPASRSSVTFTYH